jgi:hypothetical protein
MLERARLIARGGKKDARKISLQFCRMSLSATAFNNGISLPASVTRVPVCRYECMYLYIYIPTYILPRP